MSYGELKDLMETWRLRTPNEWESLRHWQDLLMWRNQIYSIVILNFENFRVRIPGLAWLGICGCTPVMHHALTSATAALASPFVLFCWFYCVTSLL